MQATIAPNQSYVDDAGVAHIVLVLEEGQEGGVPITRNIEVQLPAADFAGKTGPQRRALVVAAARAAEGRPPRAAFADVSGALTI